MGKGLVPEENFLEHGVPDLLAGLLTKLRKGKLEGWSAYESILLEILAVANSDEEMAEAIEGLSAKPREKKYIRQLFTRLLTETMPWLLEEKLSKLRTETKKGVEGIVNLEQES